MLTICDSFKDSRGRSPRNGVLARHRTVRAQQFSSFAVLKSQERSSGTISDCHDAAATLICDAEVPDACLLAM
eukprot:801255-Pyramimonas_sp.AAC.1